MTIVAYDPQRVAMLRTRTDQAHGSLTGLRCDDRGAEGAMRAVRLAQLTLEQFWIPFLDQLMSSAALVEWVVSDLDDRRLVSNVAVEQPDGVGSATLMARSDSELIDEYRTQLERFRDLALAGPVDADTIDELAMLLDETARRLRGRPAFRSAIEAALGERAIVLLLSAIETGYVHRADGDAVRFADDLVAAGHVLAALSKHHIAAGVLEPHLERSDIVPALIERSAASWETDQLAGFLADAAAHREIHTGAHWGNDPSQPTRAFEALLRAAAGLPDVARLAASDDRVMAAVLTDHQLDSDAVETFLTSALLGATRDPNAERAGWQILATSTRIAGERALADGARRGVAVSLGEYLGPITRDLDAFDITIALNSGERLEIGDVGDFEGLLADLLADRDAQIGLAVSVGVFREQLLTDAERQVGVDGDAARHLGERLGELALVVDRIRSARSRANDRRAFEHANRQLLTKESLGIAGTIVSKATPGMSVVSAIVGRLGNIGVARSPEPRVPDTDLEALSRRDTRFAVLGLLAASTSLRHDAGLDAVDEQTWRDIDELLQSDGTPRSGRGPDIEDVVERTPALRVFMADVLGFAHARAAAADRPGR